jgi:hypothetical protein
MPIHSERRKHTFFVPLLSFNVNVNRHYDDVFASNDND